MEMKRLASRTTILPWLVSRPALVAWYKSASDYGESFTRPAMLLLIVLAIFTLLFPWAGLGLN